jgi:hypothetical protein
MPIYGELLTLDQCKRRLESIFYEFLREGPPKLHDGRGHKRAVAYGRTTIALPKWARNPWVLSHEAAHIMTARGRACSYCPQTNTQCLHAPHGPEFVANYREILDYLRIKPYAVSEMELIDMGIDFA